MPRKSQNASGAASVPKFTIERPKGKKTPCAKVVLPTMPVDGAADTLTKLIEQAVEQQGAQFIRGTLNLYKANG